MTIVKFLSIGRMAVRPYNVDICRGEAMPRPILCIIMVSRQPGLAVILGLFRRLPAFHQSG
jgi:hypothetical protein